MKILYLSVSGGGLDTNIRVLAPALVRAGYAVFVLYIHLPGETIPNAASEIEGARVYHARTGNWHYYAHRATFGRSSLPLVLRTQEYAWALARQVASIQSHLHLDLIELPEMFMSPRLTNGIPFVMRLHSAAWTWRKMLHERSGVSDALEIRMERRTLRDAQAVSSPSVALAEYVRQTCGLGKLPIEIIPYPIDTARFAPNAERANPPLVLFVGRVEKRKGAHVLMRAIPAVHASYPDCEFAFAGRINEELREQVESMQSRVRFLGVQPREHLAPWYQRAAIFVAPSLWDNSPNTIYEAMACGTPVVATRVGGIPELVEDGVTGLLVPPSDADALASAITALLNDPARREQMGRRAREKAVSEYALENIAARTVAFYQRVLAG